MGSCRKIKKIEQIRGDIVVEKTNLINWQSPCKDSKLPNSDWYSIWLGSSRFEKNQVASSDNLRLKLGASVISQGCQTTDAIFDLPLLITNPICLFPIERASPVRFKNDKWWNNVCSLVVPPGRLFTVDLIELHLFFCNLVQIDTARAWNCQLYAYAFLKSTLKNSPKRHNRKPIPDVLLTLSFGVQVLI